MSRPFVFFLIGIVLGVFAILVIFQPSQGKGSTCMVCYFRGFKNGVYIEKQIPCRTNEFMSCSYDEPEATATEYYVDPTYWAPTATAEFPLPYATMTPTENPYP